LTSKRYNGRYVGLKKFGRQHTIFVSALHKSRDKEEDLPNINQHSERDADFQDFDGDELLATALQRLQSCAHIASHCDRDEAAERAYKKTGYQK
jgi:hypothetical protein